MGITSWLIDSVEKKSGENMDYMRDIASASPAAVYKFALCFPFMMHRKAAPLDAYFLAAFGALKHEDCGPCLQIAVNQAIAAHVAPELISAAVAGGSALDPEHKAYFDFGGAVAANAPETEELRLQVSQRLSPAAMADLAIGIASARVFPALKRALGHAQSCSIVQVKVPGAEASKPRLGAVASSPIRKTG
jgi:hypothetical protein